jgi:hypothetical protein
VALLHLVRPGTSGVFNTVHVTGAIHVGGGSGPGLGQTITMPIVGSTRGPVWGDGIYTDDSSWASAAVHAGVVQAGELAFVRVTGLPGQDSYSASSRNGVESEAYGPWGRSFRIERIQAPWSQTGDTYRLEGDHPGLTAMLMRALEGKIGAALIVEVVGGPDGPVWGTDVYTHDSSIAAAATHAGVLAIGERGFVKVTVLPGQNRYVGSERNGVVSQGFGSFGGSFRVERAN